MITVKSAKCIGIEAVPVSVEVHISNGIGIHLVGLADAAVKESLLRTITALQSTGFHIPGKKIVINLAPADIHKNGSGYDIPIAMGIIAASEQIPLPDIDKYMIMGELGLDGSVRDIPGALPIAELAEKSGLKGCILPFESAIEAEELCKIPLFGIRSLEEAVKIVSGDECGKDFLIKNRAREEVKDNNSMVTEQSDDVMDFSEIFGQPAAKRGLEIAAAGGHNVLLIGPPGSGKSSLAKATSKILPPMTRNESVCTSKIYSVAGIGRPDRKMITQRPFRSPHYSSSIPAIIGGGSDNIRPGEISLAHNGILFLDEFCEMPKKLIESLRAPIEDRKVTISRLKNKITYPASFMMIAATNPCPCGYYGDGDKCTCTPAKRIAYLSKLSGPIMDRIDIHLWLSPVGSSEILSARQEESSCAVAERVLKARKIQEERFRPEQGISCNAEMNGKTTRKHCRLDGGGKRFMQRMMDRNGLSARGFDRVLKLARTIADLDGSENIEVRHLAEASGYRLLDKLDKIM